MVINSIIICFISDINFIIQMQQHLYSQLQDFFLPSHLEVINESHNHSGNNPDSHFKIIIVSSKFAGKKLIDRHRLINNLFKKELQQIHAMAMHTYTDAEWSKKNKAPDSPKCAGG